MIDLFAGPGGLCEGFTSITADGKRRFAVKVSIEKDPIAHKTLFLRSIFRKFGKGQVPITYYAYVRGKISREAFMADPDIKVAAAHAATEARCAELGLTPHEEIDAWIREALGKEKEWVLIGGPPCQAYSLAGRSRLRSKDPVAFEADSRHFLYTEYLRIIQEFAPAVFVMENVKGMLNSKHGGQLIFKRILADLANPRDGLSYQVRSMVVAGEELKPKDYVIQAEDYGIPQNRHRVILFGIRSDMAEASELLEKRPSRFLLSKHPQRVSVGAALAGLPRLRGRLSGKGDSHAAWLAALREAPSLLADCEWPVGRDIAKLMSQAIETSADIESSGGPFMDGAPDPEALMPHDLKKWLSDSRLRGVLQHETRSHMRSDLHRYLFASCFAKLMGYPPTLHNFPSKLLPAHLNVDAETIPFKDRFRVQISGEPSSTVVAHIKKDGHYYIHPDPAQCRSLTVREAARLQTFPDNYFFEGNRTEQYGQIGNAVPPLLARKIAEVVLDFMDSSRAAATSGLNQAVKEPPISPTGSLPSI
nr:DNA cytosine methyltransferase [uncultured Albidiferax sp.]